MSEVLAALAQIEQQLDALDLASLTADERVNSAGKLREGEDVILDELLDTVDSFPQTFAAIADKDHGTDDARVETGPTRQALARRRALAPISAALLKLSRRVDDDLLVQAEQVRDVTTPAYAILKANAAVDAKLRKRAAKVFDYYAARGRPRKRKGSEKDGLRVTQRYRGGTFRTRCDDLPETLRRPARHRSGERQ